MRLAERYSDRQDDCFDALVFFCDSNGDETLGEAFLVLCAIAGPSKVEEQ